MKKQFEVELRAPITKEIIKKIKSQGGNGKVSNESDVYFRFLAEPLPSWIIRIRKRGASYVLTYKSNKKEEGSWVEVEMVITKDTVQKLKEFYLDNGFTIDVEIEKRRETYIIDEMIVNIDSFSQIGTYMEVEIITKENKIDEKKKKILKFFKKLNINEKEITNKGYVHLMKEYYGKA